MNNSSPGMTSVASAAATSTVDSQSASGQRPIQTSIPLATKGRLAFLLVQAGDAIQAIADERLSPSDVDSSSYCILATLSVDGPGSQHELANLLCKAPGVIVAEIDGLEAKGFVQRNRDPQDRRRSRVTLTAGGEQALALADELADATSAELLPGLSSNELSQLADLLARGFGLG